MIIEAYAEASIILARERLVSGFNDSKITISTGKERPGPMKKFEDVKLEVLQKEDS